MITAVYLESPFKPQNRVIRQFEAAEAQTVIDAAALLSAKISGEMILSVNGQKVAADHALKDGDFVVIAPNVLGGGGGGGKNIAGIVAGIALMAFSGGAGAGLMGILGTTQGSLGLGLALYFGGSLLMGNQKTPKVDTPSVQSSFENGYGWSPNQVRLQPGSPLPITYGTFKTSGQLIARRVYSGYFASKQTQYLSLLLAAGEGPLNSITDIEINDTPIGSIQGASYDVRLGTNDQTAISGIISSIIEYQAFSSELPLSDTAWITKTQTEPGEALTLDFVFPAGLYYVDTGSGATMTLRGTIRWQYREVGSSTWLTGATTTYAQSLRRPFYFSIDFTPPDPSKCYEFRAQNYTLQDGATFYGGGWIGLTELPGNTSAAINWIGLTVTSSRKQAYTGTALVYINLPATENLSGSMPKVSWKQTRATVNVWNPVSAAYETRDADNIAWMVYDLLHQCKLLRNIQTGFDEYVVFGEPKENLNYTEFTAWAAFCAETAGGAPRGRGNALIDSPEQIWPIIQKIATSGRAFIVQQAGVFKPVWDSTRAMSQIFTSGNIIDGSLSGSFLPERERASALEVSFFDEENGYERTTIFVPGDDYNPAGLENPSQIFLPCITSSKTAFMWAKHQLKKNKYLKRTQTLQADIDSIVAELGDVVGIQSDITSWGTGGRIMGATTTSVVIDQAVTLAPGSTYSLLIRYPDDTLVRRVVDAVLVSTTTTTLNFTGAPWPTAPERYCVYSFGINTLETKPFQITGIRRNGDLQATLELLEYVADVYTEATDFPVIDYTAVNAGISSLTVKADSDTGKLGIAWTIPTDRDYTGSVVYVDGKPQGFFTTDVTDIDIDAPPGTHTVTVRPVDGSGNYGTETEEEVTLGSPTLSSVSAPSLSSTVRGQSDGTNLVYITGTFTIPDLASSVLVEIGEGSNPAAWATVQDSRVAAVQYGPVSPGTLYTLRFTAKNRYAAADPVLEPITTAGDTTAPNAPSIGVTSYLKTVKIKCALSPFPSDMAGFEIFRHTANNSAAAVSIGKVDGQHGVADFLDTDTAYGMTYYYWAKAFDTWKNPSGFSAAASTLISTVVTSDLADEILSESRLFAQGVVDAAALSNAALKQAGGAVAAWSAKGCTTASIAEAGGVVDTTGNGNNGSTYNSVTVVDSEIGKAFDFDGVSDYIATPVNLFSGTSSANPASLSLFIKHDSTQAVTAGDSIIFGQAYFAGFGLSVFNGRLRAFFRNSVSTWASSNIGVQDAWQHIALVWGGQSDPKVYVYLNGALVQVLTITYANFSQNLDSYPLRIASALSGGGSAFTTLKGQVAHPKVFNRALTFSEIKSLYMFPDDAVFARITADFIGAYEVVSRHMASDSVVARILAAGAVTMEKLLVGAPGAALNDDPGFMDPSAWETMDGYASSAGWALASIADGKVGSGVMRGNGTASPTANAFIQKRYTPIDLSKTYRLHALGRKRDASTNGTIYLSVRCYNNAKSVLSTSAGTYLISAVAPGTTWTEYNATIGPKGQFQFPAGTAFARIGGLLDYNTTAGAGYELQDFRLEECTPSTLIQEGAILGQHLTVEEAVITVGAQIDKLVVGNAHISDLHGSKITAGTLAIAGLESSAQTTITDAYSNAVTALTNAATAQTTANNAASAAATAQTTANNAATAASNAQDSADTANDLLADIAADNKLMPSEKKSVRKEWDIIAAEKSVLNAQATTFGITTQNTTYNTNFQALATYLNAGTTWSSGIPSWISDANLGTTTSPIVGATFRTNWKAYYDARTALLNAISAKAKTLADTAQSTANDANSAASAAASAAATAQTTANNAATAASNAQNSATSANNLLADIAADNKLMPSEKKSVRKEWDIVAAEKSVLNAQATTFGITTQNTTYNTNFQALATYLNAGTTWSSGIPSWISDANLGTPTSPIVGATFRANWKAYYDARTALLNAISAKAKTLADAAQSTANDAASAASAAASSAATANTKAGNLATNGLGIKVNYATFGGANNGELYLHGFDASTGAAADVDGWVMWNGAKVTVTKGVIDPNAICPYNIPLYAVQRSGTKYIVWFDTGSMAWKYAAASAAEVLGTWTWVISTDIVLLTFVSPSNEGALVGTQLFVPPKTGRDIQDALDAAILSWAVANNLTYIDGAKIFTDTIYAHSINAAALKAPAGAVLEFSAKGATTATIALAGGVKDVSGNGNNGQAYGGVTVVDSELGKAFSFDGVNDYIAYANDAWTRPELVSCSLWAYMADWTVAAKFISKTESGGFNLANNQEVAGKISAYIYANGAYRTASFSNANISAGWHHLVLTYDGTTIRIYLDGNIAASSTPATYAPIGYSTAALLVLGAEANALSTPTAPFFGGLMTNVRLFSRAITAAEVKTLYMLGTDTESGIMTADRVVTGQLKSTNYSTNAGSLLDLDNGNFTVGGSAAPVFALNAAAKTGQLAGFSFNVTDMTSGSGSTAIGISTDTAKKAFWAGHATPGSAPFYVAHNGTGKIGLFNFTANGLVASEAYSTLVNQCLLSNLANSYSVAGLTCRLWDGTNESSVTRKTQISFAGMQVEQRNASNSLYYSFNNIGEGDIWNHATVMITAPDGDKAALWIRGGGNVYVDGNCSAASFTDRTEMPESMEEALEIINTMQPAKGKVDYKRLSNKAKKFTVQKADDGSEYIEEGRDLTKTVSALIMVCQKLQEENIRLSDRLAALENRDGDEEPEYIKTVEKVIEGSRTSIRERAGGGK